jgi:hypothetical protein
VRLPKSEASVSIRRDTSTSAPSRGWRKILQDAWGQAVSIEKAFGLSNVSPVIQEVNCAWWDVLPDPEHRASLIESVLLKSKNIRVTLELERLRAWLGSDWLVRDHTAAWVELAGLDKHAAALRALAPIVDAASAVRRHGHAYSNEADPGGSMRSKCET